MAAMQKYTKDEMKEILKCSICLDIFTNPMALPCFHTYCKECLHDLPQAWQDDKQGILCPLCQQFFETGQEKTQFMTNEFVSLYRAVAIREKNCSVCENQAASWLCLDCELYMCAQCKSHHIKMPITKGHVMVAGGEDAQNIINQPLYCSSHPNQLYRHFCVTCKLLICHVCEQTGKHRNHRVEVADEAAEKRFVPVVTKKIDAISCSIKVHQMKVDDIEGKMRDTSAHYEQVKQQIVTKREASIAHAHAQHDLETKDMEAMRRVEIDKFGLLREKQVKEISEKQALISNLTSKISAVTNQLQIKGNQDLKDEPCQQPPKSTKEMHPKRRNPPLHKTTNTKTFSKSSKLVMWNSVIVLIMSIILFHAYSLKNRITNTPSDSRHVSKISTVVKAVQSPGVDVYSLPVSSERIAMVNDEIWIPVPFLNLITVIGKNGSLVKEIGFPYHENLCPRSVIQVNASEVFIASNLGVFVVEAANGEVQYQLQGGNIHDVSKDIHLVAALDMTNRKVLIYKYDKNDKWKLETQFETLISEYDTATLVMFNKNIYICSFLTDIVHWYKASGKYIQSLGVQNNPILIPGLLFHAYISVIDLRGMMLLCDSLNHRLQLLSPEGQWSVVSLGDIVYPKDFIIVDKYVYVLWGTSDQQKLRRYQIL